MHGVGPVAIARLREALADAGLCVPGYLSSSRSRRRRTSSRPSTPITTR